MKQPIIVGAREPLLRRLRWRLEGRCSRCADRRYVYWPTGQMVRACERCNTKRGGH